MKQVSVAWMNFVSTHNTWAQADLYTFTPQDGSTPLRWTTSDTDLVGYSSIGPVITREGTRQTSGGETATINMVIGCGAGLTLPSTTKKITLAASEGYFDGCGVQVDRAVMPSWGDMSLGLQRLFTGTVADVTPTSTTVELTCKSKVELLRQLQMPKRLFQAACPYDLYGAACSAAKNPVTVSVGSGSTPLAVVVANGSDWTLGTIQFTSGPNQGLHRQIASGAGTLVLTAPLPYAPVQGDTATLLAGCDKSFSGSHGCNTFANQGRFGGFPWIPRPESIR